LNNPFLSLPVDTPAPATNPFLALPSAAAHNPFLGLPAAPTAQEKHAAMAAVFGPWAPAAEFQPSQIELGAATGLGQGAPLVPPVTSYSPADNAALAREMDGDVTYEGQQDRMRRMARANPTATNLAVVHGFDAADDASTNAVTLGPIDRASQWVHSMLGSMPKGGVPLGVVAASPGTTDAQLAQYQAAAAAQQKLNATYPPQKSSTDQVISSIQNAGLTLLNPLDWASFGGHIATDPAGTISGIGQSISKIWDPNATAGERTDGIAQVLMLALLAHGGVEGFKGTSDFVAADKLAGEYGVPHDVAAKAVAAARAGVEQLGHDSASNFAQAAISKLQTDFSPGAIRDTARTILPSFADGGHAAAPDLPAAPVPASPDVPPQSGMGVVGGSWKTPPIDLQGMTADEISNHAEAVGALDRARIDQIFGDQADQYRKAQRMENSLDAATSSQGSDLRDQMEASLSEDQRNQLFGIGDDHYLDPQQLGVYADKAGEIDHAADAKELGWALNPVLDRVTGSGHELTPIEEFQLLRAQKRAQALGLNPRDVMDASVMRRLALSGLEATKELYGLSDADLENAVQRFKNGPGRIDTAPMLTARVIEQAADDLGLSNEQLQAAISHHGITEEDFGPNQPNGASRDNAGPANADLGANLGGEAGGTSTAAARTGPAVSRFELPGERPSADWSARVVRRPGESFTFSDGEEASMYDAIVAQSQRITRDLEKQYQATSDPSLREDLNTQIAAERRSLQEDLDAFFSEKKIRDRIRSGVDPDLDAQFRSALDRDQAVPQERGTRNEERGSDGTGQPGAYWDTASRNDTHPVRDYKRELSDIANGRVEPNPVYVAQLGLKAGIQVRQIRAHFEQALGAAGIGSRGSLLAEFDAIPAVRNADVGPVLVGGAKKARVARRVAGPEPEDLLLKMSHDDPRLQDPKVDRAVWNHIVNERRAPHQAPLVNPDDPTYHPGDGANLLAYRQREVADERMDDVDRYREVGKHLGEAIDNATWGPHIYKRGKDGYLHPTGNRVKVISADSVPDHVVPLLEEIVDRHSNEGFYVDHDTHRAIKAQLRTPIRGEYSTPAEWTMKDSSGDTNLQNASQQIPLWAVKQYVSENSVPTRMPRASVKLGLNDDEFDAVSKFLRGKLSDTGREGNSDSAPEGREATLPVSVPGSDQAGTGRAAIGPGQDGALDPHVSLGDSAGIGHEEIPSGRAAPNADDVAAARERLSNLKKGGFTRLPFGDIKQVVSDLAELAHDAISKGRDLVSWTSDMVRSFGERIQDFAQAAWEKARTIVDRGELPEASADGRGLSVSDLSKSLAAGDISPADFRSELWRRARGDSAKSGLDPEQLLAAMTLGVHYVKSGVDTFSDWARKMVEDAGEAVRPHLRSIWDYAHRTADELAPDVTPEGDHLQTAPRPSKRSRRGLAETVDQALFTTNAAAKRARRQLADSSGRTDLEGSKWDIEEALNRQTRIGGKIEKTIYHGFSSPDGEQLTMGLDEMKKEMTAQGFDYEAWQKYRRAQRENNLAIRSGAKIDPDRVLANQAYVSKYLADTDPEQVSHFNDEFDKFADKHLQLYEKYGLRGKGWADSIRADNPDYYPMHRAPLESNRRMGEINPQSVASPDGQVIRAEGGARYMDGFSAMARDTERVIRAGELNEAINPFLKAAASQPDLEHLVKDVTDDAGKRVSEAAAKAMAAQDAGGDPFQSFARDLEKQPREGDVPEITVYDNGEKKVYRLDPDLWDAIRGQQPEAVKTWSQVMQGFGAVARAGTTSHNPFFTLIFRPLIHGTSAMLNFGANPLRFVKAFVHTFSADVLGKESPLYREGVDANVFMRHLGASDFLEQHWLFDPEKQTQIQRWGDAIAQAKGIKVFHWTSEGLSKLSDSVEEAMRLGFYDQMRTKYVKDGVPEIDAQRKASYDAANLMNFGEAGQLGRGLSKLGVPFANIPAQTMMSLARGFKRNPTAFMARAVALITVPKMLEYMTYRNDDDYKRLPDYVKDGSYVFKVGGQFYAIRFPEQLGVFFAGMPRRMMEAIDDPAAHAPTKAVDEAKAIYEAYKPPIMPTAVALAAQQGLYMNEGMVTDLRFQSASNAVPRKGQGGDNYKQLVQQADTALGSLGRLGARALGYFTGHEKSFPDPLQRFAPEPLSSGGKLKIPGMPGKSGKLWIR
jgi:hypothetical protein